MPDIAKARRTILGAHVVGIGRLAVVILAVGEPVKPEQEHLLIIDARAEDELMDTAESGTFRQLPQLLVAKRIHAGDGCVDVSQALLMDATIFHVLGAEPEILIHLPVDPRA